MKSKFIKSLIFLIVAISNCGLNVLAQSKSIIGVYRQCPFYCRFIKINADFTFEELLDGDLFNKQRTKGTWKFIGKNKIKANSSTQNVQLRVKETTEKRNDFLITVVDWVGGVLPKAEIVGESKDKHFKCLTDESGKCEIPKTQEFMVNVLGFHGKYKIKDNAANEFLVEITKEQLEPKVDEVWLIEKNRLFVADEKGNFDKKDRLERVSNKRAKNLFP